MTDIELLELLDGYYTAQRNVLAFMILAMRDFEYGREQVSWSWLFDWCEAIDEREAIGEKFKLQYPRAMMLKEGYYP